MKNRGSWTNCAVRAVALLLLVAAMSGCASDTVRAPVITGLNPSNAAAGGPAFTLKVLGTGFLNTDVVLWNGAALATVPVSGTELDALVPASLIASAAASPTGGQMQSRRGDALRQTTGDSAVTVTVFEKPPGDLVSNGETFTINPSGPTPAWTITKTHIGSFTQGTTGSYTITATNSGTAATSGTATVTDTPPASLTPATASGTGWNCTVAATVSCTRSDSLAAGGSYPNVTLTVAIATNAPASVTNSATISGGGVLNPATGSDTAPVAPAAAPAWTITKTHTGSFPAGGTGTYTITVTNSGNAATSGTATVTDTLPSGLTAGSSITGSGWGCTTGGGGTSVTCTRNDSLATGVSYPVITLQVDVAVSASGSVTNTVSVSGGGVATPATATDPTIITSGTVAGLTISTVLAPASVSGSTDANAIVEFKNTGTTGFNNVNVSITGLGVGVTAVALGIFSPPGSCTLATLSCTLSGTFAPGDVHVVVLTYQATAGTPSFTATATLSAPGAQSATSNFSSAFLNCTPGPANLCGQYILFTRDAGSTYTVIEFVADGLGNVTSGGVIDVALGSGSTPIQSGSGSNYSFDADGLGNLIINAQPAGGFNYVFKFALDPATGTSGSVIEFDPAGATFAPGGGTQSGSGFLQLDTPDYFATQFNGTYSLGLIGGTVGNSRLGLLGALSADGNCHLASTGATGTINSGGTLSKGVSFTGSLGTNCFVFAPDGEGSGNFTSITGTPSPAFSSLSFEYFILDLNPDESANHILLFTTAAPFVAGILTSQHNGPYSTNSALDCGVAAANLGCTFAFGGATGGNFLTGNSFVLAGLASLTTQSNTAGAFSLLRDENNGGTVTSGSINATYNYNADGTGSFTPASGEVIDFVLNDIDTGVVLSEGSNVSFGSFGPAFTPAGPFNPAGSASAKFAGGTQFLGVNSATTTVGLNTVTQAPTGSSTGNFSGNIAFWNTTSHQNSAALTGSYTTGAGLTRISGTTNIVGANSFAAYPLGTNHYVVIGITSADANGVLVFF